MHVRSTIKTLILSEGRNYIAFAKTLNHIKPCHKKNLHKQANKKGTQTTALKKKWDLTIEK